MLKVLEDMEKQILDCCSSERIMTESNDDDIDSGQPPAKMLGQCLGHGTDEWYCEYRIMNQNSQIFLICKGTVYKQQPTLTF